jgi:uncharacterized protein (TIGR00255 family)
MPHSMTGFGKASAHLDGDVISIEISAVNHRFLDCSVRTPSAWSALEPLIKQAVRNRLGRGKIQVFVNRKRQGSPIRAVHFDAGVAKQYADAAAELGDMLASDAPLSIDTLAQLEGVFYHEEPDEDIERVRDVVIEALNSGLSELDTMRANEGAALAADLHGRVDLMRETLAVVEEHLPRIAEQYETRLRTRIDELKGDTNLSEERIAMEVALLAEKADVTEEVVRLKTHLDHTVELLGQDGPIGRQLDFLSQEIQREVNTLGVKSRECSVTREILTLKSELEKIREQVQNIE